MGLKPKFVPTVYATLRAGGMSNREIARQLGVSETAVRRGLEAYVVADRPPVRREFRVTVEEV